MLPNTHVSSVFFLDPLFAEHPAILPFLASGSKMQRMRPQKLSCILASVKVSLFTQAVVPFLSALLGFFFLLFVCLFVLLLSFQFDSFLSTPSSLSSALEWRPVRSKWDQLALVVVSLTQIRPPPLLLPPPCKIIACVFTCCAQLGRRDTNTERRSRRRSRL